MASYQRDQDDLAICPYNACHKVKKCRLQAHIAKCRIRNEEEEKKICPFNAQHHVSAPEYQHHLQTCPDRGIVDRKIARYFEEDGMDLPQSSSIGLASESWDNEMLPRPEPVYDPKKAQKKPIFQDTSGMLPSEKKRLYSSLFRENGELPAEPEKENMVESGWALKQLRQPKMEPEVMKFRSQESPAPPCSSLGLGRGQPSGNRRIAANIFGQLKPECDRVESNCLGRGIGRGYQLN